MQQKENNDHTPKNQQMPFQRSGTFTSESTGKISLLFSTIKNYDAAPYAETLIRQLIDDDIDINAQDENGNTALHLATQSDRVMFQEDTFLHKLLERGADASLQNNAGKSPLHLATEKYHHLSDKSAAIMEKLGEPLASCEDTSIFTAKYYNLFKQNIILMETSIAPEKQEPLILNEVLTNDIRKDPDQKDPVIASINDNDSLALESSFADIALPSVDHHSDDDLELSWMDEGSNSNNQQSTLPQTQIEKPDKAFKSHTNISQKIYKSDSDETNTTRYEFVKEPVLGDGNCGFTCLGYSRDKVITLLRNYEAILDAKSHGLDSDKMCKEYRKTLIMILTDWLESIPDTETRYSSVKGLYKAYRKAEKKINYAKDKVIKFVIDKITTHFQNDLPNALKRYQQKLNPENFLEVDNDGVLVNSITVEEKNDAFIAALEFLETDGLTFEDCMVCKAEYQDKKSYYSRSKHTYEQACYGLRQVYFQALETTRKCYPKQLYYHIQLAVLFAKAIDVIQLTSLATWLRKQGYKPFNLTIWRSHHVHSNTLVKCAEYTVSENAAATNSVHIYYDPTLLHFEKLKEIKQPRESHHSKHSNSFDYTEDNPKKRKSPDSGILDLAASSKKLKRDTSINHTIAQPTEMECVVEPQPLNNMGDDVTLLHHLLQTYDDNPKKIHAINRLIEHKIDSTYINKKNHDGNTALHLATQSYGIMLQSANESIITKLVRAGADVGLQNNEGNSPLHLVVQKYSPIVDSVSNFLAYSGKTRTLFSQQVHVFNNEHLEDFLNNVKQLLITCKQENNDKITPFSIIVANSDIRFFKLMCTTIILNQQECEHYFMQPLNAEMIDWLLEKSLQLANDPIAYLQTLLRDEKFALDAKYIIADRLDKFKQSQQTQPKKRKSPDSGISDPAIPSKKLKRDTSINHTIAQPIEMECAVDPQTFSNIGDAVTSLHHLLQTYDDNPKNIHAINQLIEHKVNSAYINTKNHEGNTALHLATQSYRIMLQSANKSIITKLVGAGANVSLQNKEGNSPLHLVVQKYSPIVDSVPTFLAYSGKTIPPSQQVNVFINGHLEDFQNNVKQLLITCKQENNDKITPFSIIIANSDIRFFKLMCTTIILNQQECEHYFMQATYATMNDWFLEKSLQLANDPIAYLQKLLGDEKFNCNAKNIIANRLDKFKQSQRINNLVTDINYLRNLIQIYDNNPKNITADRLDKFKQPQQISNFVTDIDCLYHLLQTYDDDPKNIHAINQLIENKANSTYINAKNHDGNTALHLATQSYRIMLQSANESIITKLVRAGADVALQNNEGNNPLHLVVQKYSPIIGSVSTFLAYSGKTPTSSSQQVNVFISEHLEDFQNNVKQLLITCKQLNNQKVTPFSIIIANNDQLFFKLMCTTIRLNQQECEHYFMQAINAKMKDWLLEKSLQLANDPIAYLQRLMRGVSFNLDAKITIANRLDKFKQLQQIQLSSQPQCFNNQSFSSNNDNFLTDDFLGNDFLAKGENFFSDENNSLDPSNHQVVSEGANKTSSNLLLLRSNNLPDTTPLQSTAATQTSIIQIEAPTSMNCVANGFTQAQTFQFFKTPQEVAPQPASFPNTDDTKTVTKYFQ